ncbi:hypothetical protein ACMBCN_01355 [Candidatus Liberibacter asiaticus]|nr:hypothetical protein [Candidatus Liberibacter asiaticus]
MHPFYILHYSSETFLCFLLFLFIIIIIIVKVNDFNKMKVSSNNQFPYILYNNALGNPKSCVI